MHKASGTRHLPIYLIIKSIKHFAQLHAIYNLYYYYGFH